MSDFSLSERFDLMWRFAIAYGVIAILFTLELVSFSIPYAGQLKPFFVLMAVMYWAIYRPSLLSPVFIFALGLAYDFIAGQPFIGMKAFILLAVFLVIRDQRLFLMAQPFIVIWLFFALTAVLAALSEWLIFSVLSFRFIDVIPSLLEAGISVLIFPSIAVLLNFIMKALPEHHKTSL